MCGLAGFWSEGSNADHAREVLGEMADCLAHRGPDDSGVWYDGEAGIGLAHRRLSILDLSTEGHQPMRSASGRYVIVYNGEIYNFLELRRELEAAGAGPPAFRGHSDTEVMLAAIDAWGLEAAVGRMIGMFAFALWDRRDRRLHLVRDRLGIKPLYYGWSGGTLLFGSELSALRAHPSFRGEVDRGALTLLLRHNYIPAPYSIYRGVHKLSPGTILTLSEPAGRSAPRPYWSARAAAEAGLRDPLGGSEAERLDVLHDLLADAVGRRMIADVPLGAFLSGGVDSATVVALMQAQSSRPIQTFSIGFWDKGFDEAKHAAAVAGHLGTDHRELYVEPRDALEVIPRLPQMYDEPFSDSSQIPTFLVSQLARRHVTVSLSGDGGDELFAGYNRYPWGQRLWRSFGWVPRGLRKSVAAALRAVPPQSWDRTFGAAGPLMPRRFRQRMPGYKVHRLAGVLDAAGPEALYRTLVSHWRTPAEVVIGGVEPPTLLSDASQHPEGAGFTEWMMYQDLVGYLPDDILTKVDRASMAVSLEARVPLLDHRVVELAWRLPMSMKLRDDQTKWALRQVLYRYVPKELIERPKMGFGVPLASWLRGPLREWGEELLDEGRLRREGYFHPGPVRTAWEDHLAGRGSHEYHLWDVLMFQAWSEAQASQSRPAETRSGGHVSIGRAQA